MKAFLLAAGLGTRLRPLTDQIPKCLVPINGKPLMAYWFDLFEKHGVEEILVNLHYLPTQVEAFVNNYPTSLKIRTFYEEKLLGSGGTVWKNRNWVKNEEMFLIVYGDNLTNANLTDMIYFHQKYRPVLTMAVFHTDRPRECGIATVNSTHTIVEFVEKPKNPKSNLANAGIFVASPEIFHYFPDNHETVIDLGFNVLPNLVDKMKAYLLTDYLLDIGNLERYQKAQEDAKQLKF